MALDLVAVRAREKSCVASTALREIATSAGHSSAPMEDRMLKVVMLGFLFGRAKWSSFQRKEWRPDVLSPTVAVDASLFQPSASVGASETRRFS